MHLTVAYITSRKDPKFTWFFDSLWNELDGKVPHNFSLVIVSPSESFAQSVIFEVYEKPGFASVTDFTPPKPNVWQGRHRLTKQEWFAAANARNTALCLAPDGYIAYVDDLSVLMPGWLSAVREAMAGGYVACGAYKKVKHLNVEHGVVKSYEEYLGGIDGRWKFANGDPCPAEQGWLFGCSCAMPVDALLAINGWPEIADGIGMEDCTAGIALMNAGYKLMYDRRMMTLESEEHHHVEPALRREDWHRDGDQFVTGGNGVDDCSHALLNLALGSKRFEYDVGGGFKDLRELRQHILNGGEFPVRQTPEHHWYTKLRLDSL